MHGALVRAAYDGSVVGHISYARRISTDRGMGPLKGRGRIPVGKPSPAPAASSVDAGAGSGNRTVAGMGAGYHDRRSRRNRRGQAHPEHSPDGRDDTATNDADGFRRAARLPRDGGAERAVMEATGRMHRGVARSPRDRGFAVVVVNPRRCRDLPGASGAPGRTDRAGAGVPAALSAAFPDMAATAPADVTVDRLRDMLVPRGAPVDRRAELGAVPGGAGEPEPDGPVRRVLEEPDAAVSEYGRRIERACPELRGSRGRATAS